MKKVGLIGLLVGLVTGTILLVSACAGPAGPQGPAGPSGPVGPAGNGGGTAFSVNSTQIQTAHSPLTLSQIADMQPGLGTIMIEYATRMNNLWFAAQKNNWDMVHYQIGEMREIQEVGETTRANRAPMLKAFESGFLDPLDSAAQAKDLTAFTTAYDKALTGCNACHAASSSGDFKSYKFVKVVRPTAPNFNNVDWAGQ